MNRIRDNIDLAIIATPIQTVPMILRACVQKKIHSALIVSDCRRIKGQDRKNIESEIAGIAYQGHMRLVGPNSLGLINQAAGLNVSYAATMPEPGKMAFVSQSGSIFTATLDMAFKEHFGFSYFINVGAMLDIDFGDLVDYLGNDPSVDSILLYIEELKNIRKFMSAARAVSLIKPIVVLRPGMHGKNRWSKKDFQSASYDAAFKRTGIISVGSIDELFDCAELMAKQTRPRGRNLVVINNGSAPGSKEIDVMAEYNMDHYSLSDETISRLDKVLPSYWSRKNPINLLSGAGAQDYVETVKVCLSDKSVNGILLTMAPQAGAAPSKVAAGLVDAVSGARIPIMASWYGGRDMAQGIILFNGAGIPTFRTPEKAIRAFSHLLDYQRNRERIIDIPAKLNQRLDFQQGAAQEIMARHRGKEFSRLTIPEVRDLLEAYGIPFVPTRLAHDPEEAMAVAHAMGYPVAMKLFSRSM
ncbi:MAG: acetate--CoA ligase family protein, partial [Desulfobacterales bacterium]|nr:acetate--CoA ligase family protein [Desulfobacterales bacterium]